MPSKNSTSKTPSKTSSNSSPKSKAARRTNVKVPAKKNVVKATAKTVGAKTQAKAPANAQDNSKSAESKLIESVKRAVYQCVRSDIVTMFAEFNTEYAKEFAQSMAPVQEDVGKLQRSVVAWDAQFTDGVRALTHKLDRTQTEHKSYDSRLLGLAKRVTSLEARLDEMHSSRNTPDTSSSARKIKPGHLCGLKKRKAQPEMATTSAEGNGQDNAQAIAPSTSFKPLNAKSSDDTDDEDESSYSSSSGSKRIRRARKPSSKHPRIHRIHQTPKETGNQDQTNLYKMLKLFTEGKFKESHNKWILRRDVHIDGDLPAQCFAHLIQHDAKTRVELEISPENEELPGFLLMFREDASGKAGWHIRYNPSSSWTTTPTTSPANVCVADGTQADSAAEESTDSQDVHSMKDEVVFSNCDLIEVSM